MLALDGSVYVVPVAGSTETGAGTTFCIEATAALAGCPAAVIHTRPAPTATSRATAGYPSRKRRGRGTGTRMMPSVGRHEQDQLTLLIDRLMSSSCPDRDSITVIVGAAVPGLLPHLQVVQVGSAVGGGGGGPDGVGAGGEGGGDGGVGPGVPVAGGVERELVGHQRTVDRDVHRPGGGDVALAISRKSTFGPPLTVVAVARTVLVPALSAAVILLTVQLVHTPVLGNDTPEATTVPLTLISIGRSVVVPLP